MSVPRRALAVMAVGFAAVVAAAFIGLTILPQTGLYATYTVLSDSMQPAIGMGSVVVVSPADPASLQPGDVISYTSAQPPYPTITHRIVRISQGDDGRITFKTKGDFNLVEDSWDVHYSNRAGRVIAAVPLAGYGVAALTTALGRSLLGLLLAGLLAVFWFRAIWARPPARRAAAVEARWEDGRRGSVSAVRIAILVWLALGLISGRPSRAA